MTASELGAACASNTTCVQLVPAYAHGSALLPGCAEAARDELESRLLARVVAAASELAARAGRGPPAAGGASMSAAQCAAGPCGGDSDSTADGGESSEDSEATLAAHALVRFASSMARDRAGGVGATQAGCGAETCFPSLSRALPATRQPRMMQHSDSQVRRPHLRRAATSRADLPDHLNRLVA